ncbi:MAG TPA: hypothetical protein VGH43_16950 [Jatrophihabitans sp.]
MTDASDDPVTPAPPVRTHQEPPAPADPKAPISHRFFDWLNWPLLVSGAGVLVMAIVLLTRFSVHAKLTRDQSIYVYGAQRFSHGVPPYVSVFDPKTPGATILGGIAATVAHWFQLHDIVTIRWTFFLVAVATVLAMYALAYRLWNSVPAAVATAVVLCSFTVFARSGLVGPEAKMPGLLFSALAMYAMVRRRWVLAAVYGGLAFCFWQPFVWFGLVAVLGGVLHAARGRRLRIGLLTFAGAAAPTVLLGIYFAANGALSQFLVAAFEYPLTGTKRPKEKFGEHFTHIAVVIDHYRFSAVLAWCGTLLLVLLVAAAIARGRRKLRSTLLSPLVFVVFVTFLLNLFYAFFDFQSDPDTLPLLIYPALGIGGGVAVVVGGLRNPVYRRAVVAVVAVGGLVVAGVSWVLFGNLSRRDETMGSQLADACGLTVLLGKQGKLVSLGNPALFALTHRVSPTNYIYLAAGTDEWKIKHTPGGFQGWVDEIVGPKPSIIAIDGWKSPHSHNPYPRAMHLYLRADGYRRRYLGKWALWMDEDTRKSAKGLGVYLPRRPTPEALRTDGAPLPHRVPCEIQ